MSQNLPLIPGIPTIGDVLQQQYMLRQYPGLRAPDQTDDSQGDYQPSWSSTMAHMKAALPSWLGGYPKTTSYGDPFPQMPPQPVQSPVGDQLTPTDVVPQIPDYVPNPMNPDRPTILRQPRQPIFPESGGTY